VSCIAILSEILDKVCVWSINVDEHSTTWRHSSAACLQHAISVVANSSVQVSGRLEPGAYQSRTSFQPMH
jgi:hypothetical protein